MEPNPILLFELRQAVRSRFVTVLLLLYTVTTAMLLAIMLLDESIVEELFVLAGHWDIDFGDTGGTTKRAFLLLTVYYAFTTTTLVGFGAGRTASDRLYENPALFTTLPPWRIVSGKLQFGAALSLLLLSMTFPYISVLYLMRGLDVRTMLSGTFLFFGMTLLQYFAAVAFFAGVKTRIRLVAAAPPALLLQYLLTLFSVYGIPSLSLDINGQESYTITILFLAVIFCAAFTPLFLLTTVQLSPETSNRMFPVRVTVTTIQFLTLLGLAITAPFFDIDGTLVGMFGTLTFLFSLSVPYLFLFFICERETLSPRIRRTIPRSRWKRLLAYPFYTGTGGAMLWVGLTLFFSLAELLILAAFDPTMGADYSTTVVFLSCFNFGLLTFDYCATTLLLYNLFFRKRFSREWNWSVPFVFIGGLILFALSASKIAGLLSVSLDVDDILKAVSILPIPWPFDERSFVLRQTTIGGVWFAVLFAISLPWLRRQYLKFVPLEAES